MSQGAFRVNLLSLPTALLVSKWPMISMQERTNSIPFPFKRSIIDLFGYKFTKWKN